MSDIGNDERALWLKLRDLCRDITSFDLGRKIEHKQCNATYLKRTKALLNLKGQFYSHAIKANLNIGEPTCILNGRGLERTETNLKHFKWGSV